MNIGLCRVSSVSQKDNSSIPHQKKMIGDYCKMYNIELNEIITEVMSGVKSNRDGLNHLKDLVESGKVESVIVMKLDRLMRSFTEGVIFIKYLLDNNVKIIFIEAEAPSVYAETIVAETGIKAVEGLWVETLKPGQTYPEFLIAAIELIVDNLSNTD